MSNVGRRLKFARQQAGLSVGQVAQKTGISKEAIQQAEEARIGGALVLSTLPQLYGVSAEWVVHGADFEGFVLKNHGALVNALLLDEKQGLAIELLSTLIGLSQKEE